MALRLSLSLLQRAALALTCAAAMVLPGAIAAPSAAATTDEVTRVVELTNAERQKAGLTPLVANPQLRAAAQGYAEVLAGGTCWAHTCGPEPDFAKRAVAAGYTGWTNLAENIAAGQRTPEEVVAGWMRSEGHRKNIMNGAFTEIGVGVSRGGPMGVYWAQVFGARRGAPAPASAPAAPAAPAPAPAPAAASQPAPSGEGHLVPSGPAPEGAPAVEAAPAAGDEALAASLGMSALELHTLNLINLDRLSRGLHPLEWDPQLAEVARAHATDMMVNGTVSHTGSDGSTPLDRMHRAGVRVTWGGENIWTYWGKVPHEGPPTMHRAMMDEPHEPGLWNHIANILLPTYRRVGIGVVVAPNGVQYLAENFAD